MQNFVLEAKVLVAIGPPYSGKQTLGEYLFEGGLIPFIIDERNCLPLLGDRKLGPDDEEALFDEAENLLFDRILVNERTLFSPTFFSGTGLFRLLSACTRWSQDICIVEMGGTAELAIERHNELQRYDVTAQDIQRAYSAAREAKLSALGFPTVTARALIHGIDGRDDS